MRGDRQELTLHHRQILPTGGKGIDEWVVSCSLQLRAFIQAKTVAPSSVVSYGKALRYFFDYLATEGALAGPAGLDRRQLDQYAR